MGLFFSAAELRQESDVFKHLAEGLIRPETSYILDEFGSKLEQILRSADNPQRWEISQDRPVVTVPSDGDHEPDQRGQEDLYGRLSCVWEVTPRRSTKAKRGSADLIELTGIASAALSICIADEPISQWTIEVASDNAPGVYFHSQFPGSGPPIPRLPAYALTPLGSLEYLLAEVFRSRWPEALGRSPARAPLWFGIQTKRFRRTLEWTASVAAEAGSPVLALQRAVPDSKMFL